MDSKKLKLSQGDRFTPMNEIKTADSLTPILSASDVNIMALNILILEKRISQLESNEAKLIERIAALERR